ncbi:uncharacterized protein LY89DRAFT_609404 [Mollisia scopiformis]|uniref:Serine/threonine-protein kinase ppk6 n=1 Tax=Mollisia scopiformis TaxID=149040 RepID=A0A194XLT9_MOLSC|nr:uncharacterized protein LY89DRAFT_609404 [Mollisia scopiformis]KUJ21049.1 hypothetical protein LY89DRAFT_609404 [Mollisia scopiformis]
MSSDLLAEFDSFYKAPGTTQPNSTPSSNDLFSLSSPDQGGNTYQQPASTSQWNTAAVQPAGAIWGSFGNAQPVKPQQQQQQNTSQDDIWGSFETITPQQLLPSTTRQNQNAFSATTYNGSRPSGVRRSTLDMFANNMKDPDSPPRTNLKTKEVPPSRPVPIRKSSSGGDILFDAADELSGDPEDDDEFGDFETVTVPKPQAYPPPSESLNELFRATTIEPKTSKRPKELLPTPSMLNAGTLPYPQAPKSPSFKERNPFGDLGLATKQISVVKKEDKPKSASPVTAWPSFEAPKPAPYQDSPAVPDTLDEEWGDFADLPPETPAVPSARPTSGIEADAWAWDSVDKVTETAPSVDTAAPPPSNVPPPSVLLSLYPGLFDLPQSTLFKAVANQPFSLKNRIISDPSTVEFLRAYLLIATVGAHILAGRKLRWKRDTLLSQAMKIGPAAAGGKGGMKLTGVDKSEVTKEDREAADVVRIWKEQLGRLRSAIAVANQSMRESSKHLVIPEISEAMHVKAQDGVLTAPKPCVICGLKREERVSKVDLQIEDSFGEWWIEHWGHRTCRNFWQEHESKLKHR